MFLPTQAANARRRPLPPINLVVDGNSISSNVLTTVGTFDRHIVAAAPLASADVVHSCFAVPGSTWRDMLGHTGVDSAWVEGRVNILVAWETTNSAFNETSTAAQIMADAKAYFTAKLAIHPWHIIGVTALPRGGSPAFTVQNAQVVAVNQDMLANPGSYQLTSFVDVRTKHQEFNHSGDDPAPFQAHQELWYETSDWIHLTDAGKYLIAPDIAQAVATVARLVR